MDPFRLSFEPERRVFHEVALEIGLVPIFAENTHTQPVEAAWYFTRHVDRPTVVTLKRRVVLTGGGSASIRIRIHVATAASAAAVGWTVESRGLETVRRTPEELRTSGEAMPDGCRTAFWQLTQPNPAVDRIRSSPHAHELAVSSRATLRTELPDALLADAPTIVTAGHAMHKDPRECQAGIGRALDRAGWMCWSIEHRAPLPVQLRI